MQLVTGWLGSKIHRSLVPSSAIEPFHTILYKCHVSSYFHCSSNRYSHGQPWAQTLAISLLHTHTHPFNSPFSGTTQVSRYQKGKTNLDFTEARHSEWQWHQLGHMQICTSLQIDNHASTPPLHQFFTGRMPFLPPNQQRQSTEGNQCIPRRHKSKH